MKKRLLSILMALAMCLSLLPTAALATGGGAQATTYAVTVSNNGGGTITGEGSYAPGEQVTIAANPDTETGYCTAGWGLSAVGGGVIPPYQQKTTHTFTMPDEDVAISITFEQHSYISHKNLGDGTHDVHCFHCGNVQTASEPCVDVHSGGDNETPNGWCDDCSARMPGIYFVEFDPNGGEGEMNSDVVNSGESTTLPANNFTLDGHTFQGWATESTATHAAYKPGDTYTVNADTTFYAIWNDNAHVHNHPTTWTSDKDGHWYECECGDRKDFAAHNPGDPATATTPQTCTVCGYEIAPATGYTLTLNYNYKSSGVSVSPSSKTVTGIAAGTAVDLSKHWPSQLTAQGSNSTTYYFHGFVDSGSGNGLILRTVTVNSDLTLNASWVITPMITVTFDTNDGIMPYEKRRVSREQTLAVINSNNQPTRAAYEFVGWSLADDGTADSGDTLITDDCTLYAVWQQYLPSYDDDYYDPPPASIPVDVGGDYDAILRDDVVIIRGDDPISGTLDLTGTDAEAIRLPADALEASTEESHAVTICYPDDTAATLTGSGLVAARDALQDGEDLQISVTKVDAGALPENLTAPPVDEEPFGDDEVLFDSGRLIGGAVVFTEQELLDLGVISNNDKDITWEELKYLYHYMTTEKLMSLGLFIEHFLADYIDPQVQVWLDEMIERDGALVTLNTGHLDESGIRSKLEAVGYTGGGFTLGLLRQADLDMKQLEYVIDAMEEIIEEVRDSGDENLILAWANEAIAQKELEQENATITSMTVYGLKENADLTDKQIQILYDMGLQNMDNPSIGQIKKLNLTLEQMELLYAEIDRTSAEEHNPVYQGEYDVLLKWLEKAIAEKEQETKDTPTYINTDGTSDRITPIFIGAVDVNIGAVKADGTTTPIVIKADRSDAFAWSTTVHVPKLLLEAPEWNTENIRAYKVLDNGTLEAKASKVTVNADGTLTLSAMSDGNSTYVFLYEPAKISEEHIHTFWLVIDKEATETEDGLMHEECSGCGEKRNENTVIPKTGTDNLVPEPEVPNGLSTGAIVAIVIACVVVLAGGGFALYWFVFKKKKA